MRAAASLASRQRGVTVLEMMVVLIIIGMLAYVGYGALRKLTRADLVEDTNRLAALMGRAQEMAAEAGKLHRVTIDFESDTAYVEVCEGAIAVRRVKPEDKQLSAEDEKAKLEDAKGKLAANKSASAMQRGFSAANPEDDAKMAQALAGHHVGDQTCTQAVGWSGDDEGRPLILKLQKEEDIKPRQVWVQHRDDSATAGQVSIYFFPIGSAEKAIVQLGDGGDGLYWLKVHGLTGEIETGDGEVEGAEDFMKKDVEGQKEADR